MLMRDVHGFCHSETNYSTHNHSYSWSFWTILRCEKNSLSPTLQKPQHYDLVLVTILEKIDRTKDFDYIVKSDRYPLDIPD
jgi:hypothetical protein